VDSIEALSKDIGSENAVSVAVALLLGGRLTLAASRGAFCMLFGSDGMAASSMDNLEVLGESDRPTAHCAVLEESHLGALLTVDSVRGSGLLPSRLRGLVRPHIMSEHPRAACIAVLGEAQRGGASAPLVAAAVRFSWVDQDGCEPSLKRQRVESSKVRCRHILLRHTGCQSTGERRPKPTRTPHEAESSC